MSAVRRLAAAIAVAMAAAPVATAAFAAEQDPQLLVDAPAIVWSKDRIAIVVEQRGGLAGRKMRVTVHVDDGLVDGYPTGGDETPIAVEGLDLAPGSHRLMVKSGTFEARATFRYVPAAWAAGAAALVAAVVAVTIYYRRRKGTLPTPAA